MFIKINEGHRVILLNSEKINEILYSDNSCSILMENGSIYKIYGKSIQNLLTLLNEQIAKI